MDAQRYFLDPFLVHVLQVETRGDCEIHLVGCQSELSPDRRPDLNIDLWTVEGSFVLDFLEWHTAVYHGAPHHFLGLDPQAFIVHIFFPQTGLSVQTETHDVLLDPKEIEVFLVEVNHAHELLFELLLHAIDMGVVHLHGADAHQAEQFPRFFIAVTRPILSQADGHIPV